MLYNSEQGVKSSQVHHIHYMINTELFTDPPTKNHFAQIRHTKYQQYINITLPVHFNTSDYKATHQI